MDDIFMLYCLAILSGRTVAFPIGLANAVFGSSVQVGSPVSKEFSA